MSLKGVFSGAGQLLRQNGLLVTYGVCGLEFIMLLHFLM